MATDLNSLIKEAHEAAIDKGFYDCPECKGKGHINVGCIEEPDRIGCPSCNGTGIDPNRNISELLMLVITEISEAVEALRENRITDFSDYSISGLKLEHFTEISYGEIEKIKAFESCIKDTFEDEIADVFIRLFDLCGYLKIDIEKHIKAKMQYNKTRPKKHGKEF